MPQVMALKWRPQTFADMVGQEHITRTLQNAIRADRLAHAYIFSGPRGVGKTTTARIFAKLLNCRNPKDFEPCNACDLCLEVNQGSAMDVIEIDAASMNGVDDIRSLQEKVGTLPAKGKYKVYIFDEAHRITSQAFDAFLKTLEEPPAHVIFILASTEIHKFPPTVQSRCQRFEFRSMGLETTLKQLRRISDAEQIQVDDKALYQVARSAGGSMRDAQRNLDQVVAFSGKKITLEDVRVVLGTIEGEVFLRLAEAALAADPSAGMAVTRGVIEGGKDLEHFYGGILETFRHLAVAKSLPASAETLIPLSKEEISRIIQAASGMSEAQILSSLRLLIEQEWAVRHSANPQIVLETVILELCRMKALTNLGDLIRQTEGGAAPVAAVAPASPRPTAPVPAPAAPRSQENPAQAGLAPYRPTPEPMAQVGEPALAVDEIEDAVEAEKSPEMAKLKGQWREMLEKIGTKNKSLRGVMEDTRPKTMDEGTLVLVCKGPFHLEQLAKPENKAIVEDLLAEILGHKISLVPVLPEKPSVVGEKSPGPRAPKPLSAPVLDEKRLEKEEPLVAAAINIFGAKVVEVKRNSPQK